MCIREEFLWIPVVVLITVALELDEVFGVVSSSVSRSSSIYHSLKFIRLPVVIVAFVLDRFLRVGDGSLEGIVTVGGWY